MQAPSFLFKILCYNVTQQSFSVDAGDNLSGIFVVGDVCRVLSQDIAANLIERMIPFLLQR